MPWSIWSGATLTQVARTPAPSGARWSRCSAAISHCSTFAVPPNISAARSRIGVTVSPLARMASSLSQALVAMHRPERRSTKRDTPMHPGIPCSAGITSSRTCAIPPSMDEGCAWIVVERAYTIHPLFVRGSAPVAPPVHALPSSCRLAPAMVWQRSQTIGRSPRPRRRLYRVHTDVLEADTARRRIVDLTDAVRRFCFSCGAGLCNVFVPHATAGVAIIETGAGSDDDLVDTLERLLPRDDRYRHAHGSFGHGADHVLPAIVAPSVTVPVSGGEPLLGTWQSVVLVDLNRDNPQRSVRLTFLNG